MLTYDIKFKEFVWSKPLNEVVRRGGLNGVIYGAHDVG